MFRLFHHQWEKKVTISKLCRVDTFFHISLTHIFLFPKGYKSIAVQQMKKKEKFSNANGTISNKLVFTKQGCHTVESDKLKTKYQFIFLIIFSIEVKRVPQKKIYSILTEYKQKHKLNPKIIFICISNPGIKFSLPTKLNVYNTYVWYHVMYWRGPFVIYACFDFLLLHWFFLNHLYIMLPNTIFVEILQL